jgi:hypothetical protein
MTGISEVTMRIMIKAAVAVTALTLTGMLVGCTPAEHQKAAAIERTACVIDQAGQLVIVPAEAIGSMLEPIAAIPITIAHRAVQLGCAVVLAPKPLATVP